MAFVNNSGVLLLNLFKRIIQLLLFLLFYPPDLRNQKTQRPNVFCNVWGLRSSFSEKFLIFDLVRFSVRFWVRKTGPMLFQWETFTHISQDSNKLATCGFLHKVRYLAQFKCIQVIFSILRIAHAQSQKCVLGVLAISKLFFNISIPNFVNAQILLLANFL